MNNKTTQTFCMTVTIFIDEAYCYPQLIMTKISTICIVSKTNVE